MTGAWRKRFSTSTVAHIYTIEFWYQISGFKKKMPRRLLKVEAKRLILTCFETFIEANGKQLTKMNIANKVNSICAVIVRPMYILAGVVV
jgi:hypothetical protein